MLHTYSRGRLARLLWTEAAIIMMMMMIQERVQLYPGQHIIIMSRHGLSSAILCPARGGGRGNNLVTGNFFYNPDIFLVNYGFCQHVRLLTSSHLLNTEVLPFLLFGEPIICG